ncbi:uncharacterized protein MONOS_16974 [Monocercomonoides exilis]|uniref:uncharacterized protein n=1 Tax=Monocercomonoides exilis TaxID=2049356 RepID=UPI00355A9D89|nr:hypothetical protein MONOS_16974 [Monocercomonoides exilis]
MVEWMERDERREKEGIELVLVLVFVEEREEEEVVEVNGLSECEGRDGSDRGDWGDEMLEKRVLFGVEKRGKEKMAGWWVVREKFVRAMEAWAERKRGQWWWWWLLVREGGWMVQVEEQMEAVEWCWAVRSGQPARGMMLRWVTHKEVLMRAKLV